MLAFHDENIRRVESDIVFIQRSAVACLREYRRRHGDEKTQLHFKLRQSVIDQYLRRGKLPGFARAAGIIRIDIEDERGEREEKHSK